MKATFMKMTIDIKIVAVLPVPSNVTANDQPSQTAAKAEAEKYIATATKDLFERYGPSVMIVSNSTTAETVEA